MKINVSVKRILNIVFLKKKEIIKSISHTRTFCNLLHICDEKFYARTFDNCLPWYLAMISRVGCILLIKQQLNRELNEAKILELLSRWLNYFRNYCHTKELLQDPRGIISYMYVDFEECINILHTSISKSGRLNAELKSEVKNPIWGTSGHDWISIKFMNYNFPGRVNEAFSIRE